MPLQSWSKKVRQQDFNLPWAFQIGRDPSATTAGQVTVTALENINNNLNSQEILNTSITATTEDITTLFPAGSESLSGAGQLIRGIYSFTVPTESSNASTFNINESYGIRLENTGTTNVTVFNCFRSFIKRYPTETPDSPTVDGLGLSTQDEIDYSTSLSEVQINGTPLNMIFAVGNAVISSVPPPSGLVSAFSSLSGSSTTAEIQAVLNSSDYRTYYGSQLPVPSLPATVHLWQVAKTVPVRLPIVLAPGETLTLGLTKDIANFYHHPFLVTL